MNMKRSRRATPKIDPEEREELLSLSLSAELTRDMRALRSRAEQIRLDAEGDNTSLDLYIRFLTEANAFANHARKPFRRILDNDMKI